jgi:Zn-dependent peptidase ImmA (M78 family)/DNA-binding XRE family transcriptional regulator
MSLVVAPVNPTLLRWARSESGLDQDDVAKKLGIKSSSRLDAWESGEEKPTLRQAEKLAVIYKRPIGLFFLPQPPASIPLAAEYRRLPGIRPGKESPGLRTALRQLRRNREVAIDLLEENREPIPSFRLKAKLSDDKEQVGTRLRHVLEISVSEQQSWSSEHEAWRNWRDRAERLGLLVFQVAGVPLEELRGVTILSEPLPVIGVNSKDAPNSRPFTLFHELVHLMLKKSGDETVAAEDKHSEAEWQVLERFADAVAAAALLPKDALLSEQIVQRNRNNTQWGFEDIHKLSRKYWVTPLALMTRLLNLERTNWQFYKSWKHAWEEQWKNRPQKTSKGGPSRAETILSRVGPRFASLVLRSLDQNIITAPAAADYLDLKPYYFSALREELTQRPGAKPIS